MWLWLTLSGHFTWNSVFAQVRLEFLHGFFENSCIENNKGRPILSAATMFSVNSTFWCCKVYADICGGSQDSCKFSLDLRMPVSIYLYFSLVVKIVFIDGTYIIFRSGHSNNLCVNKKNKKIKNVSCLKIVFILNLTIRSSSWTLVILHITKIIIVWHGKFQIRYQGAHKEQCWLWTLVCLSNLTCFSGRRFTASMYNTVEQNINSLRLIASSNWLRLCGITWFIACDSMWVSCL